MTLLDQAGLFPIMANGKQLADFVMKSASFLGDAQRRWIRQMVNLVYL